MRQFTIALAQMQMTKDPEENLKTGLSLLQEAAGKKADLVLYPEVQLTPFFAQYEKSERPGPAPIPEDDPAIRSFQEACKREKILASPNFYCEKGGKPYDTSFLIGRDGEILGRQAMVHVAQVPKFYEQDYYTPSGDGFHVFDVSGIKIGIVVCFDRHYPESIRTEALQGAELILIPTANTKAEPMELFEQEIRVQAYQNECCIAMCNRTGKEEGMSFAGQSLLVDPDGNTILKAGEIPGLFLATVDLDRVQEARNERPYLTLRRKEWYL